MKLKSLFFIPFILIAGAVFGQYVTVDLNEKEDLGPSRLMNDEMIEYFNKERSKRGLRKLVYDSTMQAALDDKAKRMSKKGGYIHDRTGFAGEILQISDRSKSAGQAIRGWMNSPGHRDIIISKKHKFKKVCAGSYYTKDGSGYLVIRTYY